MGKYNFNITGINPESTHGKILSKIDPGTTVLECGCASGYMTKQPFLEFVRLPVFLLEDIKTELFEPAAPWPWEDDMNNGSVS